MRLPRDMLGHLRRQDAVPGLSWSDDRDVLRWQGRQSPGPGSGQRAMKLWHLLLPSAVVAILIVVVIVHFAAKFW